MGVMMAGRRLPRTSPKSRVPGAAWAAATIAHRHGPVDRGAEGARGDCADGRPAGLAAKSSVPARIGRAAFGQEADAEAGGAVFQFVRMRSAPGNPPARRRPGGALLDRPVERGLDGAGRLVEVGAIEAEPGFEPQQVARAKADGGDAGLRKQRLGEGAAMGGGDGDLEPVLARVARAGDPEVAEVRGRMATSMKRMSRTRGAKAASAFSAAGPWSARRRRSSTCSTAMPRGRCARRWARSASFRRRSPRRRGGRPGCATMRSSRMPPAAFVNRA